MLQIEQIKSLLEENRKPLEDLHKALDIENSEKKLAELQKTTVDNDFWNDTENSSKVLKEIGNLKNKIDSFEELKNNFEDTEALIELVEEEQDQSLLEDAEKAVSDFTVKLNNLTLTTLFTGEYDKFNSILTFHAGAGGTEAQDWVQMLVRMYTMWGEKHGYKIKTLDFLEGDAAGIKSCVLLVEGTNAYGFLKGEAGVHRLVRVSPFDSSGRRHTSFASLEVMPEIDDTIEVEINPDDIRMEVFRSSGAGGQKVNKTSSAVRLIHEPTGITVSCQVERSQHQNREMCMKMLKSKLAQIKEREHLEKIEDIKGVQKEIAWGSQIRSYVFMPYTMVKDHRTNYESGNIGAVMDGDLDGFINAYLVENH